MGLFKEFVSQTRKPEGLIGKMMIKGMNPGHAKMADWGMSHISAEDPHEITDLDLEPMHYDLATAFETIYFWPGLEKCFSQVANVLKNGASFLIVNESDGLDAAGKKYEKIIDGMRVYTAPEIEKALKAAGFTMMMALDVGLG